MECARSAASTSTAVKSPQHTASNSSNTSTVPAVTVPWFKRINKMNYVIRRMLANVHGLQGLITTILSV
ncbi:hypothetical protein EB796_003662 [Bugula neritina]|uniref:Uncharacterized protein n=1 Tax=Bugula neritina TaxID=10212 RepID=A0A7J7KIF6_BUGNE|nr:hypothetical protein EB796_003662 [Bugula neritina]